MLSLFKRANGDRSLIQAKARSATALFGALTLSTACSNPPEGSTAGAQQNRLSSVDSPVAADQVVADPKELRCLALSMYWEAKAEGPEGLMAVGHVVLNRVEHSQFPNSPCAVVFDGGEKPPCQFSWYCDGKSDEPTEANNWAQAQRLAARLLTASRDDNTGGALFFHGKQIKNPWRIPRTKTVTIGNHVFYKL